MRWTDAEPPQFTLSFNVSNVPATTVECSVNEQLIENIHVSRTILNGEPPTFTEVIVTIRQRSGGIYNCTVSNTRVEDVHFTSEHSTGRVVSSIKSLRQVSTRKNQNHYKVVLHESSDSEVFE